MLNSALDKLSMQALMAAVSIGIHRDITSLGETLLRTKRLGLRNASSWIDVSSLRPEIRADLPSPPKTNFSNTGTPVNRIYIDIEVQNRTLNGSEPNIDCMLEGGNLKLSLLQLDNAFEVRSQNLYGSKSSIDHSYGRENPRPLTVMGLQDRIIEVHNNLHYGSDLNINYDEGRISEVSENSRLNSSTRVGGRNLVPEPAPEINLI